MKFITVQDKLEIISGSATWIASRRPASPRTNAWRRIRQDRGSELFVHSVRRSSLRCLGRASGFIPASGISILFATDGGDKTRARLIRSRQLPRSDSR